jgi:hypothetical protein
MILVQDVKIEVFQKKNHHVLQIHLEPELLEIHMVLFDELFLYENLLYLEYVYEVYL